jgi:hypothetical protein
MGRPEAFLSRPPVDFARLVARTAEAPGEAADVSFVVRD